MGWLWLSREHASAFCFTPIVLSHLSDECGKSVVQELDGAVRFKVGSVSREGMDDDDGDGDEFGCRERIARRND